MSINKELPTGFHTFENIITKNFLYVDKTEYIYPLIKPKLGAYFLSRPRRFGKSLFISTLKAIFEGKRELFADLWLGKHSDYDFESYHVLQIDMSKANTDSVADFKHYLMVQVDKWAKIYNVTLEHGTYNTRFGELIEILGQDKDVVILIDEYDKPLLDNLGSPIRDDIKKTLKNFYTAIKAADQYVRFVLLTGVTKFSRISIFSGLNNLTDLTMDRQYATMLGFTQAELSQYFAPHRNQLAKELGLSQKEILAKIKHWYNGYRFSTKDVYVYNPYSTLLLFKQKEFKFYWFETGTPTFLLDLIKNNPSSWDEIPEEKLVTASAFSTYDVEDLESLPLLFQSGYLTIKDIVNDDDYDEQLYLLDYPNYEVQKAFLGEVLKHFSTVKRESTYIHKMIRFFKQGNVDAVLEQIRIFFANINYELEIKNEKYYQTIFFAIFELIGFNIQTEVRTSRGRIDAVVDLPQAVYLFEFKLFENAESALEQIKQRVYFEKYLKLDKQVVMVGVAFNAEKRNIGDRLIELANGANGANRRIERIERMNE